MYIVVILISLVTSLPFLVKGYFPMHDDLQVMRIFQMEKCFLDGQLPCRWVPDMGFGYGQPMFNYYSALPYYFGELLRLLTPLTIIDTVKILFALSLVVSALGMYLLTREFFGKTGALISSTLYVFAPYRALDVYVRGALAESVSLAILPFLWWSIYKVLNKPSFKNVAFASVVIAFQLATHNVSTLMYFVPTALWAFFWLLQSFKFKKMYALLLSGIFGLGLAAFFILPVVFEKSLIQDKFFTIDYFFYGAHFVSLRQLFVARNWGYGPSVFEDKDDISFQIGWPHWWIAPVVLAVVFYLYKKGQKKLSLITVMMLVFAGISAFLTHAKSYQIWGLTSVLTYVQFPWRFLGLVAFFLSFASGALGKLPAVLKQYFAVIVILLTIALNAGYFVPKMHYDTDTDESKLSGESFLIQQKSAILDYLPVYVKKAPEALAPDEPSTIEGKAYFENFSKTSSTFFFDVVADKASTIQIPVMFFPGWRVYNQKDGGIELSAAPAGEFGLIQVEIPEGKSMIEGRFTNTPIRNIGNVLTLLSFFVLLFGMIVVANKKNFLGFNE